LCVKTYVRAAVSVTVLERILRAPPEPPEFPLLKEHKFTVTGIMLRLFAVIATDPPLPPDPELQDEKWESSKRMAEFA